MLIFVTWFTFFCLFTFYSISCHDVVNYNESPIDFHLVLLAFELSLHPEAAV